LKNDARQIGNLCSGKNVTTGLRGNREKDETEVKTGLPETGKVHLFLPAKYRIIRPASKPGWRADAAFGKMTPGKQAGNAVSPKNPGLSFQN
jgi:hypothetical protein